MATYTANIATTQTLSANTVDTVTLTSPATRVTVTCSSAVGAGTVYFTVGSGSAATPTVGGSNAYAVVAGSSFTVDFDGSFPTVKLISSAALTYTVAAASVFNKLADNTVDNSTLQISNGIVSVKDGGITAAKLATGAVPASGLELLHSSNVGALSSSVTVNNVFTSSHSMYKIIYEFEPCATTGSGYVFMLLNFMNSSGSPISCTADSYFSYITQGTASPQQQNPFWYVPGVAFVGGVYGMGAALELTLFNPSFNSSPSDQCFVQLRSTTYFNQPPELFLYEDNVGFAMFRDCSPPPAGFRFSGYGVAGAGGEIPGKLRVYGYAD